jgi:hypothetical protein
MDKAAKQVVIPSRAVWDFDLGGCPEEELEHCCFYEYALDSSVIKKLVRTWRGNRKRLIRPDDEIGNLITDFWYGSSFRVLADHPEFPRKHWLEIASPLRQQKVKQLRPYPKFLLPGRPPKYTGPRQSDITQLQGEMIKWQAINAEIELLRSLFGAADRAQTLHDWPKQLGSYLNDEEQNRWRLKLSKLSGTELYNAANQLRLACAKKVEGLRRLTHELVVYQIDWTLRPAELVKRFRRWAEANRPHHPRPRSGGHPKRAVELLKALAAKRLLAYFREHQRNLRLPYRSQTLYAGLHDFTVDQRKGAGRPAVPLYAKPSGWHDGEKLATTHLKELLS